MFKSENVRILIKVLLIISWITALLLMILGVILIIVGDYSENALGVQLLVIGITSPIPAYLSFYALFALSQIETNTAATRKNLDKLLKNQTPRSDETRDSNWGSFMTEEKEEDEERPEPLHDEFGRF